MHVAVSGILNSDVRPYLCISEEILLSHWRKEKKPGEMRQSKVKQQGSYDL